MGAVRLIVENATTSPPRFSIVVPAYQAASTLGETLDAVLAQTFADWECIVVDDGSKDETLRIATSYAQRDPRIRAIHQENAGTAGAYNTGVGAASGDFIVICSADDILLPEHLQTMSAFIDSERGYDIYSSNGYFWRPGDSREPAYVPGERDAVQTFELADVIRRCFFSVGATYRRQLFTSVGGYRLGVYGEDYDFWLRSIASGARQRYIPAPLALHRVSAHQKSADLERVFRSDIRLLEDLRRGFPLSIADRTVIEEAILDRLALIARAKPPLGFIPERIREPMKSVAIRVLGRNRVLRLVGRVKAVQNRLRAGRS